MISPAEIRTKAEKWWNDKSFLTFYLKGESFFPREISQIGLVKNSEILSGYLTIKREQDELLNQSKEKKGFGYELEWEERNYQKIGKNKFIKRISFPSQLDFLKYIGKENEFKAFCKNVELIFHEIPSLKEWVLANPLRVAKQKSDWPDLLKVCKYFMTEHIPGRYYIRELPIKIHTKFIEENTSLLRSILDHLIPDKINQQEKDFCPRYGLKYPEALIRIRVLDKDMNLFNGQADVTLPLSAFAALNPLGSKVMMTENLMNFLTLPPVEGAIAIWSGGGFNISFFSGIEWLRGKNIYYWGDIDAFGLQILSQLRGYFPKVQGIMMDRQTLNRFKDDRGEGTVSPAINLSSLTEEEYEFFTYLNTNRLRFEQEKIPQEYVNEYLMLHGLTKPRSQPF